MGRSGLIVALAIWLAASAAGFLLIVLLPEDWLGEGRLFSLSPGHGPNASDAVGLFAILAGWAVWLRALWRRRAAVPPWPAAAVAVAAIACLAAIVAGQDGLALLLGLVAAAGQIALGFMTRKEA